MNNFAKHQIQLDQIARKFQRYPQIDRSYMHRLQ